MDQQHDANKHRMAARGNATSFPLPWEDFLKQLQDGEEMAKLGKQIGSDLARPLLRGSPSLRLLLVSFPVPSGRSTRASILL